MDDEREDDEDWKRPDDDAEWLCYVEWWDAGRPADDGNKLCEGNLVGREVL